MKIIKLELLEDSILAGIDAMALVESPAIEDGFFAFAAEKFAETYTDYPQAAIDAAVQGIKRNEETGNKCATQVGKVRAQQLANREAVSLDTVRRMRAFLIRQKGNYELALERKDYNACGYISYLLWGGPAALPWAEKVLRAPGETFGEEKDLTKKVIEGIIKLELEKRGAIKDNYSLEVGALPNYTNEPTGKLTVNKEATYGFAAVDEQQILVGPAMIPGKLIPRKDENGDLYYVYFTKDTIKDIAYKAMKDKVIDRVNIEHEPGKFVDDVYLVESWIVEDPETDKAKAFGLNPVEGTWMTMYKVDNLDVWEGYVKPGLVRGFSIEGFFSEELIKS